MNESEKRFVLMMNRMRRAGYDFEAGTQAALEAKFGGAADVLLRGLSSDTRSDPSRFVASLARTFGRGSLGFLEPIVSFADKGMFPKANLSPSEFAALLARLPPDGQFLPPGVPLHDQRLKDDQDNYADAYD